MSDTRTDELHQLEALTMFNLIDNVTTSDSSLLVRLKTSYIKLDSINEIINACKAIHSTLSIKSTPILREWIEIVNNIHPNVQQQISELEYYKPVSEEVGARILGYYQDTQSLQIQDWEGTLPQPIRKSVELKLSDNSRALIVDNYHAINKRMSKSLSTEFFDRSDKTIGKALTIQGRRGAPDFHMTGDSNYKTIVDISKTTYRVSVISVLKDAIRLINYLYPVNISGTVVDDTFIIKPETNSLTVNRRSDYVGKQITKVNNNVLTPEKLE